MSASDMRPHLVTRSAKKKWGKDQVEMKSAEQTSPYTPSAKRCILPSRAIPEHPPTVASQTSKKIKSANTPSQFHP